MPDVAGDNVSRAICQAQGDTLVSSVFYSLIYDTLDSRRDPHDGFYAKVHAGIRRRRRRRAAT